ncbi:hypothetical protein B7C42_07779 [Nocardia cerradoensis]|uniref:Competence protein CoiA nuclease-like domain-containing protein n=1 Tax=Nocardia cerradoensis TaxID=85688 RepID=A0A231GUD7_9NOCA|nr:competence protein CoiA family protein [Nocardia cerradoensis]OXR40155.1 hypothetical protein B7C42_07779 [Nocardia cerradoensis]
MSSSDLLTVALDLTRGCYAPAPQSAASPQMHALRCKGYSGDRTLVCALCYAEHNQLVPLIVRGRPNGQRRPHFAHPAGLTPGGGQHTPESVWHLTSKTLLAEWARTQPGVVEVRNEVALPGNERRSDVRVFFADGSQVALEVQSYSLTDEQWQGRHDAYRRNGIVDVWIWHPDTPTHWIVLREPNIDQQLWTIDPARELVNLMLAEPHSPPAGGDTPQDDTDYAIRHLPPCIGDRLTAATHPLTQLTLTQSGIPIPESLRQQLTDERRRHDRIEQIKRRPRELVTPRTSAGAPPPSPQTATPPTKTPQPPRSGTIAQLKWIELQNTFMAAGHHPDYRDAPSLRRPRPRPTIHCTTCGYLLSPTVNADTITPCTRSHHAQPSPQDHDAMSTPDQIPLF